MAFATLGARFAGRIPPGRGATYGALWEDLPSVEVVPAGLMQRLAVQGVDAAKAAGAQYADVKLTRVVKHHYTCIGIFFDIDTELVGIGVRVLVDGYWGFAASPFWTSDQAVSLARSAVAQAKENAKGSARRVELGDRPPVVTGEWVTPIAIDPFKISIEEKRDYIIAWKSLALQAKVPFQSDGFGSGLSFVREERVVATSDGSLVTQTLYETAGDISVQLAESQFATAGSSQGAIPLTGLARRAKGWELILDAKIPEQFPKIREDALEKKKGLPGKEAVVGRYTIVCDGRTMASLVDATLGLGTQLDRALGYEANASGTSFLDDPLSMVGTFAVASSLVTLTANRSASAQLATVKWDDEAVPPPDFPLIKDGVLVDFQTTREQAGWLAPYYQKGGRPVRSNGCAASQTALTMTMEHTPNLALSPNASNVTLDDLVANVQNGIVIQNGDAESDWQARGGLVSGTMSQIRNGRLVASLFDGAVLFDTLDIWKKVKAIGGMGTEGGIEVSQYVPGFTDAKGEPSQRASHSVRAVAATIVDQAIINPSRKA